MATHASRSASPQMPWIKYPLSLEILSQRDLCSAVFLVFLFIQKTLEFDLHRNINFPFFNPLFTIISTFNHHPISALFCMSQLTISSIKSIPTHPFQLLLPLLLLRPLETTSGVHLPYPVTGHLNQCNMDTKPVKSHLSYTSEH